MCLTNSRAYEALFLFYKSPAELQFWKPYIKRRYLNIGRQNSLPPRLKQMFVVPECDAKTIPAILKLCLIP